MTVKKVNAKSYSTVNVKNVARYILEYCVEIGKLLQSENADLKNRNKMQLNVIAADLETVKKRFEWIIEGKY